MARLKYNGLRSQILNNPLASGGTTINFVAALTFNNGTAVPTIVSPDFIPITLIDPSTGLIREIVYITAYTTGATSATISRGQEGTTGVSHVLGTTVVHDSTAADFGITTSYTPAWTGATTNPVLNNGTAVGFYALIGPLCFFTLIVTSGSTSTYGSGQYSFSLPVAVVQPSQILVGLRQGTGNPYMAMADLVIGATTLAPKAVGTTLPTNNLTNSTPATWTSGAIFKASGVYIWA